MAEVINKRYGQAVLKDVRHHPSNPRKGNVKAVMESIRTNGFFGTIVVQESTGYILAGNHRVMAARELGLDEVPVVWVDVDDEAAMRILLADNRTSDLATYDNRELAGLLEHLASTDDGLVGTGYSDEDFRRLLNELDYERSSSEHAEEDETAADELLGKWKTARGQLWRIGEHRLLCGSSTDVEDVARLFGEEKADQMITDPPYGVDYSSKNEFLNKRDKGNRIQRPIENDAEIEDYRRFFADFLSLAPMSEHNTVYVFISGRHAHNLRMAFDDADFRFTQWLIWAKNNHVLGRMDYSAKHEEIAYGWKGKHKFYGPHRTTLLEYDKPLKSEHHPTQKPIELVEQLLGDGSLPGHIVYDAFLGSGTTMLAAANKGRRCFGMEYEPVYVATVLERMQQRGYEPELVEEE